MARRNRCHSINNDINREMLIQRSENVLQNMSKNALNGMAFQASRKVQCMDQWMALVEMSMSNERGWVGMCELFMFPGKMT